MNPPSKKWLSASADVFVYHSPDPGILVILVQLGSEICSDRGSQGMTLDRWLD